MIDENYIEEGVLGCLIIHPKESLSIIEGIIESSDFEHEISSTIFEIIKKYSEIYQSLDVNFILAKLQEIGKIGLLNNFEYPENYIYQLSSNASSTSTINCYADIIKERSIKRAIKKIYNESLSKIEKNEDIKSIINSCEKKITDLNIEKNRKFAVRSNEVMGDFYEKLSSGKKEESLKTGFFDLDSITSGFSPSDLIVIGARPSMGKTSFAINIAENVSENHEKPILIFSLEMSCEQLNIRMISSNSSVSFNKIKQQNLDNEDYKKIATAICNKKFSKILIDDDPIMTPSILTMKSRNEFIRNNGLSLIVIDYLQKISEPSIKNNKNQEITYIISSIKNLCKELNIPIIVLSQLNRSLESRADKRPILSDLRESGGIEQEADVVIFLYRDEFYNKSTISKGICEISVTKNRNGPCGIANLRFLNEFTRFKNL